MPINAQWHREHRMPAHPSFEERARWHLEHREVCGCRPIPEKLAEEMRERGLLSSEV
jgi:hypothetical protein